MKIEEVPQDKGYLIEGRISDLNYVVDKDGHYTSKQSKGWLPKNEAIRLAWEQVYEHTEKTRKQVLAGKLSPIAFYMELNIMDIAILASYTGISKWKVRKHLKIKHFNKLKPELLSKYAEVLNVTPAELVNTDRIREIKIEHED
jgi:hypothetical protein